MKKRTTRAVLFGLPLTAALLVGCASQTALTGPGDALAAIRASFTSKGIADVDRLNQDEAQSACSSEEAPNDEVATRILKEAQDGVVFPTDGKYLGDWRKGEELAQNGRGMTWSDVSDKPSANGGSCYNCHQITKEEVAFGNIGPSLYHYGKLRGVVDPNSEDSAAIVRYTWQKLWNSRTYSVCSFMPRYGHQKLLDTNQLRDLMALLLDPKSPVNAN